MALKKFTEAAWKFQAYFFNTVYGFLFVLGEQGWMWDTESCWSAYPLSVVPRSIYWYYMMELGVYIHELVNVFTDDRRKDFVAMVTHHISTLILISGSYIVNFIPIGSLVMVVHDVADSFLEAAKLFNYATKARPWAQKVRDHVSPSDYQRRNCPGHHRHFCRGDHLPSLSLPSSLIIPLFG